MSLLFLGRAGTFATPLKVGANFPYLGHLLSSFGKSRQEQGVSQRTITAETPPIRDALCAPI